MLIAIYGKSGVGKSTMLNYINSKTKYKKIVTYTTRPRRDNEINGVDYHFVSTEQFKALQLRDVAIYNNYLYGTSNDILIDQDSSCILEVQGIAGLVRDYEHKLIVVKVCSDITREERATQRQLEDNELFEGEIANSLNTISFNITNNDTLEAFYKQIKEHIEIWEALY
jgi:guanylate kinase